MANLTLIEAKTLGSSVASVTFNSIPQTYTDLRIVMSARYDQNGDSRTFFNFNGTGYNASSNTITAYGTGTGAENFSSNGVLNLASYTGTGQDTGTFANASFDIPNYTTSNNKTIIGQAVQESNVATIYNTLGAGLWTSSVAAITSIEIKPAAGNFITGSTFYLYGVTSASYGAKATGGVIYQDASYIYHAFINSGVFTPTQSISADILMVGGGGSGSVGKSGTFYGSGGGAGQVVAYLSQSLTTTSYTATIGAGGNPIPGTSLDVNGNTGNPTTFTGQTAATGGGGGLYATGSGGTSGNGYAGGSTSFVPCGGGGGAGGVGGNVTSNALGGVGGVGLSTYSDWLAPLQIGELVGGVYYIGGGGSGSTPRSTGGYGGGGSATTIAGKTGTGSGGGGGEYSSVYSGAGGSGLVIVRYAK